jgi:hypothetical protein
MKRMTQLVFTLCLLLAVNGIFAQWQLLTHGKEGFTAKWTDDKENREYATTYFLCPEEGDFFLDLEIKSERPLSEVLNERAFDEVLEVSEHQAEARRIGKLRHAPAGFLPFLFATIKTAQLCILSPSLFP